MSSFLVLVVVEFWGGSPENPALLWVQFDYDVAAKNAFNDSVVRNHCFVLRRIGSSDI